LKKIRKKPISRTMTAFLVSLRQLRDLLTQLTTGSGSLQDATSSSQSPVDTDEICAQVESVLRDFVVLETEDEVAARAIADELRVIRQRAIELKLNRTLFRYVTPGDQLSPSGFLRPLRD
jgi:hypothetical protein